MPEFLRTYLLGLTPAQADEVWLFFDGDPRAAELVIEVVAPIAVKDPIAAKDPVGQIGAEPCAWDGNRVTALRTTEDHTGIDLAVVEGRGRGRS